MGVILVMSQVDLVTDLLMLVQYSNDGRTWAFAASTCFLGLGWAMHLAFAWFTNAGRDAKEIAREVLIAATFLAPVVGTYRFVVGADVEDSASLFDPVLTYVIVKVVELAFESIPESVLQVAVLLQTEADDGAVSGLSVASFVVSLLAAGLLMADLNYTTEQGRMKAQQTPGVHPLYSFLRASAWGQAALFLSSWAFLSAYLTCTVFAFGSLLVTQPWWVFFGLVTTEYWALAGFKVVQGEFGSGADNTNSTAVPFYFNTVYKSVLKSTVM